MDNKRQKRTAFNGGLQSPLTKSFHQFLQEGPLVLRILRGGVLAKAVMIFLVLGVTLGPVVMAETSAAHHNQFFIAAKSGDTEAVIRLLKRDADVNWRNETGATGIMWAAYRGDVAMVSVLLDAGADPTMNGVLPLPGNGTTAFYGSPLSAAAGEGHLSVVRQLVEKASIHIDEPGVNRFGLPSGWTALMEAAYGGHKVVARYLMGMGANVNAVDETGQSALFIALSRGHGGLANMLMNEGAAVAISRSDGYTPLHSAASVGLTASVLALLAKGAKVEARDGIGWAPLHSCSSSGNPETCATLIQAGADINGLDAEGETPLHLAARGGNLEIVDLLLKNGADTHMEDSHGYTALDSARSEGHSTISERIIAHMDEELSLDKILGSLRKNLDTSSEEFETFRNEVDPNREMTEEQIEGLFGFSQVFGTANEKREHSVFLEAIGIEHYPEAPAPGEAPLLLRWDFSEPYQFVYKTEQTAEGGVLAAMVDDSSGKIVVISKGEHTAELVLSPLTGDSDDEDAEGSLFASFNRSVLQGMEEDSKIPGAPASQQAYLQTHFPLPDKPLSVGDSTTLEAKIPFNAMGSLLWVRGGITLTLRGYVFIEGHVCAELDVEIDLSDLETPEELLTEADCWLQGEGKLYFDTEDGCFHSGEIASLTYMSAGISMQMDSLMVYERDSQAELALNTGG